MAKEPLWKRVSSGKYVDMNNLQPDDLHILDVETALNSITRFTGHWKDVPPLTVAQHSMLCLNLAQMFEPDDTELHLAVFTHDFAESLIGDVSTPIKRAMGDAWKVFSKPIETLFELKFLGYRVNLELHDRVKLYDLASMDIERRVMWSSVYGKDKWPASPLVTGTIEDKKNMFNMVSGDYIEVADIWKELYDKHWV